MRSVLAMVLFSTVACGGDGGGGPPTVQEAIEEVAAAYCGRYEACSRGVNFTACVAEFVDVVCGVTDCQAENRTPAAAAAQAECLDQLPCENAGCDGLGEPI